MNEDAEPRLIKDFWEELNDKLRDDYDPYAYVDELYDSDYDEESIEDFEWEYEE